MKRNQISRTINGISVTLNFSSTRNATPINEVRQTLHKLFLKSKKAS
ncbi:hypothetical protein LJC34_03650 [Oscillospiraceae bacterium OttesenSCG-928-G22]|nr:hypothetical protein [Oscillospiraceae bacterium OttesenSCG-928-G22]